MKTRKQAYGFAISALIFGLVMFVPAGAWAVPMISLDAGGGNSVTITDGDANDLTGAADGTILFNGMLGNFAVLVSLGIDATTSNVPDLTFSNTAVSGLLGGSLTAMFTTTDIAGPLPSGGVGVFDSAVFGGTMGSVSYQAFLDAGNNPFAQTTPLTNFAGPFGGAFADTDSVAAPALAGPYSLTMVFNITQDALQATNANATLEGAAAPNGQPIPEPATLFLFGTGLLAVGIWRWRKMKVQEVV